MKFAKFLRTPFFIEHLRWMLLANYRLYFLLKKYLFIHYLFTRDFCRNLNKALFQKSLSQNTKFFRMFLNCCVLKNWKPCLTFWKNRRLLFRAIHLSSKKYWRMKLKQCWYKEETNWLFGFYWFSENTKNIKLHPQRKLSPARAFGFRFGLGLGLG